MSDPVLMAPLFHLNGSSAQNLLDGYRAAYEALGAAEEALAASGPNARDYYPKGDGTFAEAAQQHSDRVQQVSNVRAELLALYQAVEAQVDEAEARRKTR